jgi:hypothetical protein
MQARMVNNLATFRYRKLIEFVETSRWYAKDVECPCEWKEWLDKTSLVPRSLCPHGPGDIMQNLPEQASALYLFLCTFSVSLAGPRRDSDVLPRYRRYIHAVPQRSLRLFWTQSYVLY